LGKPRKSEAVSGTDQKKISPHDSRAMVTKIESKKKKKKS
jgi:hypothetical protein